MAARIDLSWEPVAAEKAGDGRWRVLCAAHVGDDLLLIDTEAEADDDAARRFLAQHGIDA